MNLSKLDTFPKISKANSILFDNQIFYVKKVDSIYVAWIYPQGYKITVGISKEDILSKIQKYFNKKKDMLGI